MILCYFFFVLPLVRETPLPMGTVLLQQIIVDCEIWRCSDDDDIAICDPKEVTPRKINNPRNNADHTQRYGNSAVLCVPNTRKLLRTSFSDSQNTSKYATARLCQSGRIGLLRWIAASRVALRAARRRRRGTGSSTSRHEISTKCCSFSAVSAPIFSSKYATRRFSAFSDIYYTI